MHAARARLGPPRRGAVDAGALAAAHHRRPPDDADRLLNRAAAAPAADAAASIPHARLRVARPSVGAAMSEVDARCARDARRPRAAPAYPDLREPRLRRLFYDDSRPGTGADARPERCGDQARARAYRARKK